MQTRKIVGALCIIAAVQFLLVMLYLESIVPGFDRASNFISDLGVGATAPFFNGSLIIAGIIVLVVSVLLFKLFKKIVPSAAMMLLGISIICVGAFPEDTETAHLIASYATFLLGSIVAMGSFWYSKKPISYVFVILGAISFVVTILTLLVLVVPEMYIQVGDGLIERLIVYPFLIWGILFGEYLIKAKP